MSIYSSQQQHTTHFTSPDDPVTSQYHFHAASHPTALSRHTHDCRPSLPPGAHPPCASKSHSLPSSQLLRPLPSQMLSSSPPQQAAI